MIDGIWPLETFWSETNRISSILVDILSKITVYNWTYKGNEFGLWYIGFWPGWWKSISKNRHLYSVCNASFGPAWFDILEVNCVHWVVEIISRKRSYCVSWDCPWLYWKYIVLQWVDYKSNRYPEHYEYRLSQSRFFIILHLVANYHLSPECVWLDLKHHKICVTGLETFQSLCDWT